MFVIRQKPRTALLVIDPLNDFISEGARSGINGVFPTCWRSWDPFRSWCER
jgi:hypothetical protein